MHYDLLRSSQLACTLSVCTEVLKSLETYLHRLHFVSVIRPSQCFKGLTETQRVLLMQIHAFISFEIRPQLESGEYPLDSRPLVLFSAPLTVVSCRGGFCIRRPRRRWRHGQAFWMSDMPNSCPNTETPLTYPELLEQTSSTSKLRAKIGI